MGIIEGLRRVRRGRLGPLIADFNFKLKPLLKLNARRPPRFHLLRRARALQPCRGAGVHSEPTARAWARLRTRMCFHKNMRGTHTAMW